jgi:predicted amidohydrolase
MIGRIITPMPDSLIVAAIQMEPRIGQTEYNLSHSLSLIGQAADQGATLAVLPELTSSGYVFETRDEAMSLAEDARTGPAVAAWSAIAAERKLYLVAGLCERAGDKIYNSAVVIGPGGPLGVFRKVHLWDQENRFFTPGDLGFPVLDLPFGKLGVFICYDGWFPESYRACALAGADIICVPTNWVPMPSQPAGREVMANTLVMAGAHSNGVFVIAADRIGIERGQPFLGNSLIVGPAGFPLAGPAPADAEVILTAEITPAAAADSRRLNGFNHLLQNRRPGQYAV